MFTIVGASTAKVYAFTSRVWELERYFSVDFFDNYGSTIYIDFFGLYVKRIMPRINSVINFEWISDRIRFFYDSLFVQRIFNPFFFKKKEKKYVPISWFGVYWYFKCLKIFFVFNENCTMGNIYYYIGLNIDLYSLLFLKNLFFTVNSFNVFIYTLYDNIYYNYDLINMFYFPLTIKYVEDFSYIYICGYNIRCEHPLLFFYLNSLVESNKIKIYVFGISFIYNIYNFKNLGLSLKDFYFFYKFFFFRDKNLDNILLLVGSMFLNRYDFYVYDILFKKMSNTCNLYGLKFIYKYIYSSILDNNLIYLGLGYNFRNIYCRYNNVNNIYNYFITFCFFENNFLFWYMNQKIFGLTIYIGSHFFELHNYDLLLPLNFSFENDFLLVNLLGFFIRSKFIYAPANITKTNINYYMVIFNFFLRYKYKKSNKLNKVLNYIFKYIYIENNDNLLDIFDFNNLNLYIRNIGTYFINYIYMLDKNIKLYLYNNIYLHYLNNYYITNIISFLSYNLMLAFIQNEKKTMYINQKVV